MRLPHHLGEVFANFTTANELRCHEPDKSHFLLGVEGEIASPQLRQSGGGRVVNVSGECFLDSEIRLTVIPDYGVPVSALEHIADVS